MIYLDSSVALAALLSESRRPPEAFWAGPVGASELLQYEVWNRLYARDVSAPAYDAARFLLGGLVFFDLAPHVLRRALQPLPNRVKTLDGLHLATMDWLRTEGQEVRLATYDRRLAEAAAAMGFDSWNWDQT